MAEPKGDDASRFLTAVPVNIINQALWQRLNEWSFDDARVARPLSKQVMQHTGWGGAFTQRVIAEYRRFLYLAICYQGQICPSAAVDEIWHRHILMSHHYFEIFCPQVLGRILHHYPSTGGHCERQRHHDNYAATLQAYRDVFRHDPPVDIWPSLSQRFAERYQMVDLNKYWILPKPSSLISADTVVNCRGRRSIMHLVLTILLLLCGILKSEVALAVSFTFAVFPSMSGPQFLKAYLFVALVLAAWGSLLYFMRPSGVRQRGVSKLDVEDYAYLAGGEKRAVLAGMAALLQQKNIKLRGEGIVSALSPPEKKASALQKAIYAQVEEGIYPEDMPGFLEPKIYEIHGKLHQAGLLSRAEPGRQMLSIHGIIFMLITGLFLVGGWLRLVHGLMLDKPIFFLFILLMITTIPAILFFNSSTPRQTTEGVRLLKQKQKTLSHKKNLSESDAMMPLAFALMGYGVLSQSSDLMQVFPKLGTTGNDSGSFLSDSGSDGGGDGCSGCGGCGGD